MSNATLSVWTDSEQEWWVIAESAEDAVALVAKHYQVDACDFEDDYGWGAEDMQCLDGSALISVRDNTQEHEPETTLTAAEWVRAKGRGILCNVDW